MPNIATFFAISLFSIAINFLKLNRQTVTKDSFEDSDNNSWTRRRKIQIHFDSLAARFKRIAFPFTFSISDFSRIQINFHFMTLIQISSHQLYIAFNTNCRTESEP